MDSILNLLKPIADSAGISMAWVNATAINVMFGTGAIKSAFGIRGYWNLLSAGGIALAMGFAGYHAVPATALIGASLVFAATALTFTGLRKGREKIGERGSANRGPEPRG